jgi:hypothetical protein
MQARGAYLEPVGAVLAAWEWEWLRPRRLGSNGDWCRALDSRSVMGHGWASQDEHQLVRMRVQ